MELNNHDTGIRKQRARITHNNLMCKKVISEEFEGFKKSLEELCKKWNFDLHSDREWDGKKQITFMPVLKSRRIRFGKLR